MRNAEDKLHLVFATALTLGAAALFYVPALRATGGDWPAPLDDVFIHYDFARSIAQGHPFEWIPGQGYSSGETSPLYPFVLAIGYLLGFRGLRLGIWAAMIACASLVVVMRTLRELVMPAPRWVSWLGAVFVVAVGVLDWSWFSGMEIALFGAACARTLRAVERARSAPPDGRRRAQWRVGAWGAALVLLRPEAGVLVAVLSVVVARRAGARSALAAVARAGLPAALATGIVLGANLLLTGDAASAGARLKLLSANPYLSDVDRARELAMNLLSVRWKVLETYLSAVPALWPVLPSLAAVGLLHRRTRALAAACLAGAVGWALLVSWNGAARFQNFRYYMPALALVLFAAVLGLRALSRARRGGWVGALTASLGVALALPRVGPQVDFFRDAASNIHDQQVEVGRRLARTMPVEASVLVGDAGAIPYVSERHAVDALGLGGYRGLPFARAATEGEASIVELIERMRPEERPAYLAVYPNWFRAITGAFGHELARVSLAHNVICGGVTKVIYQADWAALEGAPANGEHIVDEVDVGDVVSEAEHAYASPAPYGGWTLLDIRLDEQGRRTFDGGRTLPPGRSERFVVQKDSGAPPTLVMRTDAPGSEAHVAVLHEGRVVDEVSLEPGEPSPDRWTLRRARLRGSVRRGDAVVVTARASALHDFHVWLEAPGV